jgi:hypothetical protein
MYVPRIELRTIVIMHILILGPSLPCTGNSLRRPPAPACAGTLLIVSHHVQSTTESNYHARFVMCAVRGCLAHVDQPAPPSSRSRGTKGKYVPHASNLMPMLIFAHSLTHVLLSSTVGLTIESDVRRHPRMPVLLPVILPVLLPFLSSTLLTLLFVRTVLRHRCGTRALCGEYRPSPLRASVLAARSLKHDFVYLHRIN